MQDSMNAGMPRIAAAPLIRSSKPALSSCATVTAGENGGRADVRWASVQDKSGHGVSAIADTNLLQMSVTQ